MQELQYKVTYPVGLHARPSEMLSKECRKYYSSIIVSRLKNGRKADGKSTLSIMHLGVITGEMIALTINGDDENTALTGLQQFCAENL